MKTLSKAEDFRWKNLLNPELLVILNSEATKTSKNWCTLVDVDKVQVAYEKQKDINWLYKNLVNEFLDDVAKTVVETANSATSTMVKEATDEDIPGFQSCTRGATSSNTR
uniref:Uncharacterized protein n=1 Tax=Amphimedon queenslandica TaxID=400682 RepID=A0A1X7U7L4_AMPQE